VDRVQHKTIRSLVCSADPVAGGASSIFELGISLLLCEVGRETGYVYQHELSNVSIGVAAHVMKRPVVIALTDVSSASGRQYTPPTCETTRRNVSVSKQENHPSTLTLTSFTYTLDLELLWWQATRSSNLGGDLAENRSIWISCSASTQRNSQLLDVLPSGNSVIKQGCITVCTERVVGGCAPPQCIVVELELHEVRIEHLYDQMLKPTWS
jgi:hypothetical protein